MADDQGFAFRTQLSFQSRRVLSRRINLHARSALHSITIMAAIDDRWESGNSGYDPCDPRFDMKAIVVRILSGHIGAQIKPELQDWQALLQSETPPIGAIEVTQFVNPRVIDEHEYPPVDCTVCVEPSHAEQCAALLAEKPEGVRGSMSIALRKEDLLEKAHRSAWQNRYLGDIDTDVARTFPVMSLQLEVQEASEEA